MVFSAGNVLTIVPRQMPVARITYTVLVETSNHALHPPQMETVPLGDIFHNAAAQLSDLAQ